MYHYDSDRQRRASTDVVHVIHSLIAQARLHQKLCEDNLEVQQCSDVDCSAARAADCLPARHQAVGQ